MEKKTILFLSIVGVTIILFFLSNYFFRGYLRSELTLAKEIKTPIQSIDDFKIADEPPFKYRFLFSGIVSGTYDVFYDGTDVDGFFNVYKWWSLLFYTTSAATLFWLLLTCGFNESLSFWGTIGFLIMPAMLFAYTLPVHTREDTLAYTLLFTGLVMMLKKNTWMFLFVCLLGVLCRETLLILPFVFLLYGNEKLIIRVGVAALPTLLWLSIRTFLREDYDVWLGLRWNLNNLEQVAGFTFIVFNFWWILFFVNFRTKSAASNDDVRQMFFRSAWIVLILILLTTFLGGIYNEIRLLHLFSPWIVIIALDYIERHWLEIKDILLRKSYLLFVTAGFIFSAIALYGVLKYRDKIIVPGKYAVPYDLWVVCSVCYIFIFFCLVPLVFTVQSRSHK